MHYKTATAIRKVANQLVRRYFIGKLAAGSTAAPEAEPNQPSPSMGASKSPATFYGGASTGPAPAPVRSGANNATRARANNATTKGGMTPRPAPARPGLGELMWRNEIRAEPAKNLAAQVASSTTAMDTLRAQDAEEGFASMMARGAARQRREKTERTMMDHRGSGSDPRQVANFNKLVARNRAANIKEHQEWANRFGLSTPQPNTPPATKKPAQSNSFPMPWGLKLPNE